jgi:hypothetical protein
MRGRQQQTIAKFSIRQMSDSYQQKIAEFAPYSDKNVVPQTLRGNMPPPPPRPAFYKQGAAKIAEVNAAKAGQAIDNAGKAVGKAVGGVKGAASEVRKQVVNAKNKVAVLVKGANGKAFIQQRWKNVQDAAGAAGNAAKQAGGVIKANPGKSVLAAGAIGAGGYGLSKLLEADRKGTEQLLKSQAFEEYKKGNPGLLEKAGIWKNRKTQKNPYK